MLSILQNHKLPFAKAGEEVEVYQHEQGQLLLPGNQAHSLFLVGGEARRLQKFTQVLLNGRLVVVQCSEPEPVHGSLTGLERVRVSYFSGGLPIFVRPGDKFTIKPRSLWSLFR